MLSSSAPFNTSDTGMGREIEILPNSSWEVWFEDLPITISDRDVNDYILRVSFDAFGAFTESVHTGGDSAHTHRHTAYTTANIATVVLFDITSGDEWKSGLGSLNRDLQPHAWVQCLSGCDTTPLTATPEPMTAWMLVGGTAIMVPARRPWRPYVLDTHSAPVFVPLTTSSCQFTVRQWEYQYQRVIALRLT